MSGYGYNYPTNSFDPFDPRYATDYGFTSAYQEPQQEQAPTSSPAASLGRAGGMGLGLWGAGKLLGPTAGVAPSTPAIAGVAPISYAPVDLSLGAAPGMESSYMLADGSSILGSGAPAISDAAALGGNISSGLQSLGVGSQTAGMAGTALGYGVPIAAGLYGAYNLGKGLTSGRKMGTMGGAMNGMATGAAIGSIIPGVGTVIGGGVGALAGALLGQFGHSQNYWNARARNSLAENLISQHGPLSWTTKSGQTLGIDPESFEEDPTTYNYNPGATADRDIGTGNPLAYLLTHGESDKGHWKDAPSGQLAQRFANLAQAGVAANDMYKTFGYDHDKAYGEIAKDTNLAPDLRDAYLNGLDQAFGVGAYAPKPVRRR